MARSRGRPAGLVLSAASALLVAGCLGSDYRDLPLDLSAWDSGWLAAVEPEEELWVGLDGNNLHPDQAWELVEVDDAVLRLTTSEHEVPPPGSGDPGDPHISTTVFGFVGGDLGRTRLRFELVVDGERVDVAEYTVDVVDDACAAETAAVANRCGGELFSYQPQYLQALNHGEQVNLDVGEEVELVLPANAGFPDTAWQVADHDDAVIAVDGPVDLGPARSPGDFSEVDPEVRHSFLPAWRFNITGTAPGESPMVLELTVDGERIDVYELVVLVGM
ncbi:hypothetical protein [Isoptericola sediminis]|uniref:Uncharacterized protein n=1 Tax=Isoptericola sediminis TaxID=2733572 RepID=A0A849K883_9MICO|nr:hypothetical protein [Isoptericola sediminis]NNU27985.1 hypothetical protein [Isoptericola sediminis]